MRLQGVVGQPLRVTRQYAFNCAKLPLEVYFIGGELGSGGASTGPGGAVPTISYLFHPLDFFGSASDGPAAPMTATFRHPCIDDIYDGKMVLRGADEFTWSWRISGPDKDGEICTRYTRDRDASAPL